MHVDYADIVKPMREAGFEPVWYMQNGTPRYTEWTPGLTNIYWRFSALYEVACQGCGEVFSIGADFSFFDLAPGPDRSVLDVAPQEVADSLGTGDPPCHTDATGQRCVGETMTSDWVRVVELHHRGPRDARKRYVESADGLAEVDA